MISQLIDFMEVTVLSTRGTLFVTGSRLTRKMIALRLISIGDIIKYHKPPDSVGQVIIGNLQRRERVFYQRHDLSLSGLQTSNMRPLFPVFLT